MHLICRFAPALVAAAAVITGGSSLLAQAPLDHIVARVNNRIVTALDVRQARMLQLVEGATSDDATVPALENRLLMLDEITRTARVAPAGPVTDDALAVRRKAWETRLGGSDKASLLLGQAGMTDASLQNWLRDDIRIDEYLTRQFGALPEPVRTKAVDDLLARLRTRAGLG